MAIVIGRVLPCLEISFRNIAHFDDIMFAFPIRIFITNAFNFNNIFIQTKKKFRRNAKIKWLKRTYVFKSFRVDSTVVQIETRI